MRIPKEYQPLAAKAKAQGWTIDSTNGGHLCWRSPTGGKVYTPATPSDHRSLLNVITKLRRKGMEL